MYSKKKDRELFQRIDDFLTTPKGFNKFVNKIETNHNLIIKCKDKYICTNCGNTEYQKLNKKVDEYHNCPLCHKKLLIKSSRLKHYTHKDYICVFDEFEDYYIERIYELRSDFNGINFDNNCYEWGRKIYFKDTFNIKNRIMNNNVVGTTSGYWISYRPYVDKKWYESDSYYNPIRYIDEYIYYPGTIKKILKKDEKYKYSQLWELVQHVDYMNLIYLLKYYNNSIELLIKMKLYNLALNPKIFSKGNSFSERFYGLDKSYLPFMKRYNITIDELEALSIFKIENIKLIRKIVEIRNYKELNKTINVIKALELTDLNNDNCIEYADYLSIANC